MEGEEIFKQELVSELLVVADLMEKEKNLDKKIYYFYSSLNGITGRTFRYFFSQEVLLADLVLNACYQSLYGRYQSMRSGDTTIVIDSVVFERVIDGLRHLAECFDSGEPIQKPLENILTASFSTTGPGNYLREKGAFKL